MAIDTSGKWWIGSEPRDLEEYLAALTEECYATTEFRLARCKCGGVSFVLEADASEGAARRCCASCGDMRFVCDSEHYWKEAEPDTWTCIACGSDRANVGVGFSLYDDREGVRWLYLGVRCVQCGTLGCFADWKVGYGPSAQLMDQV